MKNNTKAPLEVSPRDYHTKLEMDRGNIFSPDSFMSKTRLWELHETSPYRWRHYPESFEGSKFADWGSLVDCVITTPDELDEIAVTCPYPDFRTKAAREFRDSMTEAGKIILDPTGTRNLGMPEECNVFDAATVMQEDPIAGPVIRASKKQVVLIHPIQGVNFKALVDLAPENEPALYDIKTTGDLSFSAMSKKIATLGYHLQGYLYLKLWNLCFPDNPKTNFRLIWQMQTPPYEVVVTEIPALDLEAGGEWAAWALDTLIECTETGKWPNLANDGIAMLGRPTWAQIQDDEAITGPVAAPSLEKK